MQRQSESLQAAAAAAAGNNEPPLDSLLAGVDGSSLTSLTSSFTSNEWMQSFVHSLIVSMSVIIVSELGDKTFFITAIMAMKNSRLVVFLTSSLALLLMTVLSVVMGVAVTVVPRLYTQWAAVVLFLAFGFKMLKDACEMTSGAGDDTTTNSEYTDARREIEERDKATAAAAAKLGNIQQQQQQVLAPHNNKPTNGTQLSATKDELCDESGSSLSSKVARYLLRGQRPLSVAPVILNVFTMIFIAEWGDRSQLSTIVLAAKEDAAGVFLGSLLGHVMCNGLAVIGGRFFAEIISVRTMNVLGSITFICFGGYGLWEVLTTTTTATTAVAIAAATTALPAPTSL